MLIPELGVSDLISALGSDFLVTISLPTLVQWIRREGYERVGIEGLVAGAKIHELDKKVHKSVNRRLAPIQKLMN